MRLKSFLFGIIFVVFANCVFAQDVIPIQAKRNAIVEECKEYIGTPYLYGGLTKDGIDCSGFVFTTVRDSAGIQLPRTVKALYSFVSIIPDSKKQKGDLVFFKTVESKISHVGIYIGKDQFIHSVSDGPNTGVIVSSLKENYWKTRYAGVGTFFPVEYEETDTYIASNDRNANSDSNSSATSNSKKKTSTFSADSSIFMNWNFLTTDEFLFNVRGVTLQVHGVYNKWELHPGVGMDFKYEPKTMDKLSSDVKDKLRNVIKDNYDILKNTNNEGKKTFFEGFMNDFYFDSNYTMQIDKAYSQIGKVARLAEVNMNKTYNEIKMENPYLPPN